MLVLLWYAMLVALVLIVARYAVRAAFLADGHERKRFREFADNVENWLRGSDGKDS